MVTGCAPFFLIALAGVALGSWAFGTHLAARLLGLAALTLFLAYFALLNWTAQNNARAREEPAEGEEGARPSEQAEAKGEDPGAFSMKDRAEWFYYLQTEGKILWMAVAALLLVLFVLILRG